MPSQEQPTPAPPRGPFVEYLLGAGSTESDTFKTSPLVIARWLSPPSRPARSDERQASKYAVNPRDEIRGEGRREG